MLAPEAEIHKSQYGHPLPTIAFCIATLPPSFIFTIHPACTTKQGQTPPKRDNDFQAKQVHSAKEWGTVRDLLKCAFI